MRRFPTGRWNREQPHHVEVVNDGPGSWAVCSCGYQGDVRGSNAEADADAEGHERAIFDMHRAGQRFVRGRVESA